jgi:hypothetical protein
MRRKLLRDATVTRLPDQNDGHSRFTTFALGGGQRMIVVNSPDLQKAAAERSRAAAERVKRLVSRLQQEKGGS